MTPTSPEEIAERADAMLRQKYVVRADARQREMGLSYIEAETSEMARTIARFAADLLAALTKPPEGLDLETTVEERSLLALKGRFNYALDENGHVTGAVDWSPLPRLLRDLATLTARLVAAEARLAGQDDIAALCGEGGCMWLLHSPAREAAEDALREIDTLSFDMRPGTMIEIRRVARAALARKG